MLNGFHKLSNNVYFISCHVQLNDEIELILGGFLECGTASAGGRAEQEARKVVKRYEVGGREKEGEDSDSVLKMRSYSILYGI